MSCRDPGGLAWYLMPHIAVPPLTKMRRWMTYYKTCFNKQGSSKEWDFADIDNGGFLSKNRFVYWILSEVSSLKGYLNRLASIR